MSYDILKTRHIREVFIKLNNNKYRYLKYSKNDCLLDNFVSYSFYYDRLSEFKKLKNVVRIKPNYFELKV
jgi:hypothetical protein